MLSKNISKINSSLIKYFNLGQCISSVDGSFRYHKMYFMNCFMLPANSIQYLMFKMKQYHYLHLYMF